MSFISRLLESVRPGSARPEPRTVRLENLESRTLLDAVWPGIDQDGDVLKVTLVGEGSMVVTQPAQRDLGNPGILKIELTDTEGCNTLLTIAVTRAGGDGKVNVGRITGGANSGIHFLNAPTTNIVGTGTVVPNDPGGDDSGYGIDLQGYLRQMVIGDIRNGVDIWAKQTGVWYPDCAPSNFVIGNISADSDITLGSKLEKFVAASWAEGGVLDVKSVDALTVNGNFAAGIQTLRAVGPVTVKGVIGGTAGKPATWNIPRDIGVVKTGSSNVYWSVASSGKIASLTSALGALDYGTISAVSLGAVTSKAAFQGTSLVLSQVVDPGSPKLLALGAVKATGMIAGNWNIEGHGGAIVAGATHGLWTVDFEGDVPSLTVNGQMAFSGFDANSLGALTVKAGMNGGPMRLWRAPGPKPALGKVTVGLEMNTVYIRATGNIGAVTAQSMVEAHIFAGVLASVNGFTGGNAASYFDQVSSIASVTVKGKPGTVPSLRHSMYTSDIFASNLGALKLFGPINSGGPNNVVGVTLKPINVTKPDNTKYTYVPGAIPQPNWPWDISNRVNVVDL